MTAKNFAKRANFFPLMLFSFSRVSVSSLQYKEAINSPIRGVADWCLVSRGGKCRIEVTLLRDEGEFFDPLKLKIKT